VLREQYTISAAVVEQYDMPPVEASFWVWLCHIMEEGAWADELTLGYCRGGKGSMWRYHGPEGPSLQL
jgi:hypothetical protein